MSRPQFQPEQAKEIARAFADEGVEYVFIGKSAAILLGYPAVTQDVDVFPEKTPANGARMVAALRRVGFDINHELEAAKARSLELDGFHIANLRDIIASKRASGREKDLLDLPLLERFREEYERMNPPALRSAADVAAQRIQNKKP
jgi:hypothetical protein